MLQQIEGIILRSVKYSESSVICEVYTREHGLRSYILNGVRQQKSRIGAALVQPMSIVEMVVYHREDRNINRVKEIKPCYVYHRLHFDVIRGALGLFITELVQKTVKESEVNSDLYCFLSDTYQLLDNIEKDLANFHLFFMVQFTRYLGFMPNADACSLADAVFFDYREGEFLPIAPSHTYFFAPAQSQLLWQLLQCSPQDAGQIALSSRLRQDFIEDMLRFYGYHVENLHIYSHNVLHQVLG